MSRPLLPNGDKPTSVIIQNIIVNGNNNNLMLMQPGKDGGNPAGIEALPGKRVVQIYNPKDSLYADTSQQQYQE